MNDENQALREVGAKPVVVHPGPLSIEDLLRHVDPAPDDETELFVASIYADRREAAATRSPK
jgi:acetylglutamate kinase